MRRSAFQLAVCVISVLIGYRLDAGEPEKPDDRPAVGAAIGPMREAMPILKKNKFPMPPVRNGVCVTAVNPGSPANLGGIHSLDIITKIDDTPISNEEGYRKAIGALSVGEPVKVYLLSLTTKPKIRWVAKTIIVTPTTIAELRKAIDAWCPLEIVAVGVRRNVIGVPEVSVRLKNPSPSDAVAVEVSVECWNRFDEKVMDWGGKTHIFSGLDKRQSRNTKREACPGNLSVMRTPPRCE